VVNLSHFLKKTQKSRQINHAAEQGVEAVEKPIFQAYF